MATWSTTLFRRPLALFVIGSAAILAGCASSVPLESKDAPASSAAQAGDGTVTKEIAAARAALEKVKPSVYFDFDSFVVKPEHQATVTAFANYLKADAKARLTIEGNADERGTTEYNLALGQKRAEAVRRSLSVLGIAANRVEAISNGEEKPRAKGSTEAAWAENRRADLVLK